MAFGVSFVDSRDTPTKPDTRKPRYTYAVSNYRPHRVLRTTVLPYGSYGNKPYRANRDNTRREEHQGTCDAECYDIISKKGQQQEEQIQLDLAPDSFRNRWYKK
ncbi:hypothetical protein MRX96_016184 [Rhipicephalus microplus]